MKCSDRVSMIADRALGKPENDGPPIAVSESDNEGQVRVRVKSESVFDSDGGSIFAGTSLIDDALLRAAIGGRFRF